ncbi:hypothetical protein COU00_00460 [Candidatus Falkowbacteria bacterium CG10_big_fil_rev_8_21_14_0_10_43_11]|uniref:Uncharacterized protein n=1 Tax=Candidatus Falkowbacteria bacterium CG10_big_fil_rev_8_21_14_0_10_43_11 TaxID=1974568 RepID=A0A2M6WN09_9BACT|nr:MAG: hypothetical protein COU00_00460 [Candidatus Falkowbacteria bacterium CG10_big_fil_rev_8_21_14_0_10_43_11]
MFSGSVVDESRYQRFFSFWLVNDGKCSAEKKDDNFQISKRSLHNFQLISSLPMRGTPKTDEEGNDARVKNLKELHFLINDQAWERADKVIKKFLCHGKWEIPYSIIPQPTSSLKNRQRAAVDVSMEEGFFTFVPSPLDLAVKEYCLD